MPVDTSSDIEWLIILTFPNGGSTAIANLLLTAAGTIALNPRVEGQWLVPAMSAPHSRWDPLSILDYDDIRTQWIEAVRHATANSGTNEGAPLVIEKSPPNMCRYRAIVSMLTGMKTDIVVLTRDPYATCASWHLRGGAEQVARNWGWPGRPPTNEDEYFRALGEIWMTRASYLATARADAIHWIRYEDFSDRPSYVISDLAHRIPRLRTANPNATLLVKDYPPQKIRNMNIDQISALNKIQKTAISSALLQNSELVARFGYDVNPP